MFLISNVYMQIAPAAGGIADGLTSFLLIILMFVVLWFTMIHPQMKRQKETKAILETLVEGDEVAITGGILGKVSKVAEQYITVEIAANTEITVQKSAVTIVLPKSTLKAP